MFGLRMSEKDGFQALSIALKTPLHLDYCPETPLSLRTPAGTRPGSDDQYREVPSPVSFSPQSDQPVSKWKGLDRLAPFGSNKRSHWKLQCLKSPETFRRER